MASTPTSLQSAAGLDIQHLHDELAQWLPQHNDPLVRPNQETVQLYIELRQHGIPCDIIHRMARLPDVKPGLRQGQMTPNAYHLVLCIEHNGRRFDARELDPFEIVAQHCEASLVQWDWGDPMDLAIGGRMLRNLAETATHLPNPGISQAVSRVLAQRENDQIHKSTDQASGKGHVGRL